MFQFDEKTTAHLISGMFAGAKRFAIPSEHKCPECSETLLYTEKDVVHLDPPRARVKCSKCDYKGFVAKEVTGPSLQIPVSDP